MGTRKDSPSQWEFTTASENVSNPVTAVDGGGIRPAQSRARSAEGHDGVVSLKATPQMGCHVDKPLGENPAAWEWSSKGGVGEMVCEGNKRRT